MKGLLGLIGGGLLILAAFLASLVGLNAANSWWNCTEWHSATGEQTKVIAGSCMVHNPRTKRWEEYSSYVQDHHVGLHDDDNGDAE